MDKAQFRDWLGSDAAAQQLKAAMDEIGIECCEGCEIPLTDDVERGDSDWVGGVHLCKDCWFVWTGQSKG